MPSSKNSKSHVNSVSIGRKYEKLAAAYFVQGGFEILELNWQAKKKEIDLIVKKDNLIIFVEVKSASSEKFGHPAEKVNDKKIANLTEAALDYLVTKKIEGCDLRFDVITFIKGKLEHFPDAFEANY